MSSGFADAEPEMSPTSTTSMSLLAASDLWKFQPSQVATSCHVPKHQNPSIDKKKK